MKYRSETFDAVIGKSILHHLPFKKSFKEVFRVLRKGGLIWFSEPNVLNPEVLLERKVKFIGKRLQTTENETAFLRWRLAAMLEKTGFKKVSVKPFDFVHPLVPPCLINPATAVSNLLEKIPIIREFSGSLIIKAEKN